MLQIMSLSLRLLYIHYKYYKNPSSRRPIFSKIFAYQALPLVAELDNYIFNSNFAKLVPVILTFFFINMYYQVLYLFIILFIFLNFVILMFDKIKHIFTNDKYTYHNTKHTPYTWNFCR